MLFFIGSFDASIKLMLSHMKFHMRSPDAHFHLYGKVQYVIENMSGNYSHPIHKNERYVIFTAPKVNETKQNTFY